MDMRDQKFGIEIEMTGLTRQKAANVIAAYFSKPVQHTGGGYDEYMVMDSSNRKWKVVSDSSIIAQRKDGGYADREYKVEFVSPIYYNIFMVNIPYSQ